MTRSQFRTDDFAKALLVVAEGKEAGMLGFDEKYRHLTEDFRFGDSYCYPIIDFDRGAKLTNEPKIHTCCGCSCDVCEKQHTVGSHTYACKERFMKLHRGVLQ